MSEVVKLHSKTKGSLGQYEDDWRLVIREDGKMSVEHEWHHQNAYQSAKRNVGVAIFEVREFLSGDHDEKAKAALREVLKAHGCEADQ
jgi:hypothetical protein